MEAAVDKEIGGEVDKKVTQLTKEIELPSGANVVKSTLVLSWQNVEDKPAAKARLCVQRTE